MCTSSLASRSTGGQPHRVLARQPLLPPLVRKSNLRTTRPLSPRCQAYQGQRVAEDALRFVRDHRDVDDDTIETLAALVVAASQSRSISAGLFPIWSWPLYGLGARQLLIYLDISTPVLGTEVREWLPVVASGAALLAAGYNTLLALDKQRQNEQDRQEKKRKEDKEEEYHKIFVWKRQGGNLTKARKVPLYTITTGTADDTLDSVKVKVAALLGVDAGAAAIGELYDISEGEAISQDSEHTLVSDAPPGSTWRQHLRNLVSYGALLDVPPGNS